MASFPNTKHTTQTNTQALEKAVKYFDGQGGMNMAWWALAFICRDQGKTLAHTWEVAGVRMQ